MMKFLFIAFILATLGLATAQIFEPTDDSESDDKIISNADEYVGLSEALPKEGKKIFTSEDKKVIEEWSAKHFMIVKNILIKKENADTIDLRPNWKKRLQIFGNQVVKGFSSLKKKIFRTQSLSMVNLYDPVVTVDDIDHVLRFYRPFSESELRELDKQDSAKIKEKLNDDSYDEDVDSNLYDAKDRKFYRQQLKKYHVIDKKLIQSFVKARYELMRKDLMSYVGKVNSEFAQVVDQFYYDRLKSQVKLWERNKISQSALSSSPSSNDELTNQPFLFMNDENYRKYLNFHDDYFKGNIFYGYKKRYDDPAAHGIGFEATANDIIGERHRLMLELYYDMRQFDVESKKTQKKKSEDLPLIEYLLERFAMLTFEFPQSRFKAYQWSAKPLAKSSTGLFMIVPKHFASESFNEMRKRVDDDINTVKKASKNPSTVLKFSNIEIMIENLVSSYLHVKSIKKTLSTGSENVMFQIMLDHWLLIRNTKTSLTDAVSDEKSLSRQKYLKSTDEQISNKDESSKNYIRENIREDNIALEEVNKVAVKLHDFFDLNANLIVTDEQHLKQSSDVLSDLTASTSGIDQNKHYFGTGGDNDGDSSTNFRSKIQSDSGKKRQNKHY